MLEYTGCFNCPFETSLFKTLTTENLRQHIKESEPPYQSFSEFLRKIQFQRMSIIGRCSRHKLKGFDGRHLNDIQRYRYWSLTLF